MFFALSSAHFSGALTMFLSQPMRAPFENVHDGFQLYPKWKPVIVRGTEANYVRAIRGLSPSEWFSDIDRQGLFVKNNKKALQKIMEGGRYGIFDPFATTHLLQKNENVISSKMFVIKTREPLSSSLLFPKNSPNREMINQGILKFRESGLLNGLLDRFVLQIKKSNPLGEQTFLGMTHVGLPVAFYGTILMVLPVIVLLEWLDFKINKISA